MRSSDAASDNRGDFDPEWPACRARRTARACDATRAGNTDYCLLHLDPAGRKAHLAGLKPGDDLDLRGVQVDSALLAEVLGPFRDHTRHRFVFGSVRCESAWFTGQSWFNEAVVREEASFDHAVFSGRTRFAEPKTRWAARRRMLFEEGEAMPARVAALYRALRKSFEDSKNEAGAGDFYYGEMECRRRSRESPVFERVILWFYWLLSGYGQRASRALGALVVVIAVVTGLLTLWGQDFGLAARTAFGAVVFRDNRLELTAAGEWTVLVARFLGPVLLALGVLAVRARVKR